MTPTIKTVLALIFAILLFSWALSVMPHRDGFEPTIPEIDQINYMHLAENTRVPKKENMNDGTMGGMSMSMAPSTEDDISSRLAIIEDTKIESSSEESMLNMCPYK